MSANDHHPHQHQQHGTLGNLLGANFLSNLELLSNNIGPFGGREHVQKEDYNFQLQLQDVKGSQQPPKFDVFAHLQRLANSMVDAKVAAKQQPPMHHQHEEQHAIAQNRLLNQSREKKKFQGEVSDFLVFEVLKRKELLVENNTSRDLTFSESKRNAWTEVRGLLVSHFPGFDLGIEAIKSHWRYRKRKVTDAYGDLARVVDAEEKLRARLAAVDFAIYHELRESNLLERVCTTESPSEGDESNANLEQFNSAPSSPLLFPQQQQSSLAGAHLLAANTAVQPGPTFLLERLTATLLGQQMKQHNGPTDSNNNNSENAVKSEWTTALAQQDQTLQDVLGSRESVSVGSTVNNGHQQQDNNNTNNADELADGGPVSKRRRHSGDGGTCEGEHIKRMAFESQKAAFDEVRLLAAEVRAVLLPQLLSALHNFNAQFQQRSK